MNCRWVLRAPSYKLMKMRGAGRFTILLILAASGASPAFAHRSFVDLQGIAGSGSLAGQHLSGQYGFAHDAPFYLAGYLGHDVFYEAPDDNSVRGLAEFGYESIHFGAAARGGYLMGGFQDLSMIQFGGTVFYRFASWNIMDSGDRAFLRDRERKKLDQKQRKTTAEDIPSAMLIALSVDQFMISSGLPGAGSVSPSRFTLWGRGLLKPFLTVYGTLAYYSYGTLPVEDPLGQRTYSSRALRLVQLGPNGPYSGIFGCPSYTAQASGEVRIFPELHLNFAVTRVSLNSPQLIGHSFALGFDRFLTADKRWAISPAYELYLLQGGARSYFSISLRYGAASTYLPPGEE